MQLKKRMLSLAAATATLIFASSAQAAPQTSTIAAAGGPIRITAIFHASTQIEYRGRVIDIDPVSAGRYTKKADIILVTHTHPDHFDPIAIDKVRAPFARLVAPLQVIEPYRQLRRPLGLYPMKNGSTLNFKARNATGAPIRIRIEAVPAYNLVRGPKPGLKFHPKGQFNGYVLTLGGKRIYIAGDTEATPEMKKLKNIDAAFLPMNLPYTMTPQEAARAARAFRPRIVFPYHFRFPFNKANTNPQQFQSALRGTRIQVRILDWYPAQSVARAMATMGKH